MRALALRNNICRDTAMTDRNPNESSECYQCTATGVKLIETWHYGACGNVSLCAGCLSDEDREHMRRNVTVAMRARRTAEGDVHVSDRGDQRIRVETWEQCPRVRADGGTSRRIDVCFEFEGHRWHGFFVERLGQENVGRVYEVRFVKGRKA